MLKKIFSILNKIKLGSLIFVNSLKQQETHLLLLGKLLSDNLTNKNFENPREAEFKVFSQFGEDGILQYLVQNLSIKNKTFCEFGVEDYRESNTRFLLMNNYWRGLVIDGSKKNIDTIMQSEYFWKYNLQAVCSFVTRDNINELISSSLEDKNIGVLSIDVDGVDYWILEKLEISADILVLEYNSIFGKDLSVTVPYDPAFVRGEKHFSNLYFGASIKALERLAKLKGYSLVAGNSAGNNLFFVRKDLLNTKIRECCIEDAYSLQSFTEERNFKGRGVYSRNNLGYNSIVGMEVFDTKKDEIICLK